MAVVLGDNVFSAPLGPEIERFRAVGGARILLSEVDDPHRFGCPRFDGPTLLRIDEKVGLFNRPVESDEDVVRIYLALLVIEERAMAQFRLLQEAFREAGDEATAAVLEQIEADEGRHLKYCHAITKRYAPDEDERQRRLEAMREIEAQAFAENGRENIAWTLSRGVLSGWRLAMWKQLAKVQRRREPSAPTAYSDMLAQGLA